MDTTEAVQLLASGATELRPDAFTHMRCSAAFALLNQFSVIVNHKALEGVLWFAEDGIDRWSFGAQHSQGVSLRVDLETGAFVCTYRPPGRPPEELGRLLLPIDPFTGQMVSDQVDGGRAPRPGEPLPKRSALAVLVERLLAHARYVNAQEKRPRAAIP